MKRITFNLLGPQGSGKGTQAKALVERFGFVLFDAGEALRQVRATKSPLGLEIASYLDGGNRVPPQLIADLTYETLSQAPANRDILFDGLLRALDELEVQKQTFQKLDLPLPITIFLDIDEQTALFRIAKRRICRGCGSRITIQNENDVQACQRCGGQLEIRHDDTPEATKQRLSWYYRDTLPVIDYFRTHGQVINIDARPSIEEVSQNVIRKVEEYYQSVGRPV